MKIEITKKVEVKETVEVEFPFYVSMRLGDDYMRTGDVAIKIEENKSTQITKTYNFLEGRNTFELEVQHYENISDSFYKCYLLDQTDNGTQKNFDEMYNELIKFIENNYDK